MARSLVRLSLYIQFMQIKKKGEVTKHNLAEDQHPYEMVLITYHLQEHKFQADITVD